MAALACALAGVATAPSGATDTPPRKVVKVADDFFSPRKLSVPRNTVIVWKWSRLNGATHDVYLARKPRRAKRFQSAPAATDYTFKRKLRVAGRYRIVCTFHEEMTMRIDVRR